MRTDADRAQLIFLPAAVPPEAEPKRDPEVATAPDSADELADSTPDLSEELLRQRAERDAADRERLDQQLEQELRRQLALFVELAHRDRIPSLAGQLRIGDGEYVTSAAIKAAAVFILDYFVTGLSEGRMAAALMKAVLLPRMLNDAGGLVDLPLVLLNGSASIDVSAASEANPGAQAGATWSDGSLDLLVRRTTEWPAVPEVKLVQSGPTHAANQPSADLAESTVAGAGGTELAAEEDEPEGERAAGYAAVICGPVSAIADGRPYLSIGAITSYARTEVFRKVWNGVPRTASDGMRIARSLEVVVLLDPAFDGGLWIEVDPASGKPAAAFAIALKGLAQEPPSIVVTRLPVG